MTNPVRRLVFLLLLLLGLQQVGVALLIYAKAAIAPVLVERIPGRWHDW